MGVPFAKYDNRLSSALVILLSFFDAPFFHSSGIVFCLIIMMKVSELFSPWILHELDLFVYRLNQTRVICINITKDEIISQGKIKTLSFSRNVCFSFSLHCLLCCANVITISYEAKNLTLKVTKLGYNDVKFHSA